MNSICKQASQLLQARAVFACQLVRITKILRQWVNDKGLVLIIYIFATLKLVIIILIIICIRFRHFNTNELNCNSNSDDDDTNSDIYYI